MIQDDDMLLRNLILSDEATFRLSGHVNKQNIRIWGSQQSSEFIEEPLYSEVMVWLAISFNGWIGYHLAYTEKSYLQTLKEFFWPSVAILDNLEDLLFIKVCVYSHIEFPFQLDFK